MDALRKIYHRAVQIPLENVEKLWSELETFESGLNKITVRAIFHLLYLIMHTYFYRLRNLCLIYPRHICKRGQCFANYKDIWVPYSHHRPRLRLQGRQSIYRLPPPSTLLKELLSAHGKLI